jgi:outer membrane immunogenic protein
MMNKILLTSTAFAALIAGPATAADLARPIHRRPAVVVAAPVWTGWYVGGNVGYGWGNARTDIAGAATTIANQPFFGGIPANFALAGSNRAGLHGVVGGGQAGYNFQLATRWLWGFEADIQGSGARGSSTSVNSFSGPICATMGGVPPVCSSFFPLSGTAATAYEGKIDWFGTVRGRLGYLVNDRVLLYATGGLAYGRVELSGATNVNGVTLDPIGPISTPFTSPGTSVFSASRTNVGFAVGGGIEGRLAYWLPPNWTWKLEYLYLDLGSVDTVNPFPAANPNTSAVLRATPFTGTMTTHTLFTDNIVRAGLNYQFH